jgi:glycosyltransferase involved in cell wall biosynthesis
MRILSVGIGLSRGGTERAMQNFSISYRRFGHEVAVLAWRDDGPRREKLEREGIQVILGGAALEQGLRAAEDFDPDVIHIHRVGVADPTETAILRRLRTPRRRVLETNVFGRVDESVGGDCIDVHMHLGAWALWRWRRWAGRGGRDRIGIIVPNPVTRDFARASAAEIRHFRHRLGIPEDAFVCGRIGQANAASWHPATLKAFRHVAEQDPNARLLLIGLPDALQPMLRQLPWGIARRVTTLPLTDADHELSLVYSSLDCFLHAATVGESFGYVLTEAMLCECPVVTASTPHVSNSQVEVVEHLVGGIVAGSTQTLPEALAYLWSHRELVSRFAPHLREHVLSRFDADVVASQVLKVAELALESPDRATLRERLAQSDVVRDTVSDDEIGALLRQTLGPPRRLDLLAMRLRHSVLVRRAIDLRFRRKLRALARKHEASRRERERSEAEAARRGGDGLQRSRAPASEQSDRLHRAGSPVMHRAGSPVTVSAVMPTYNAAAYLREAIGSVIAQTFTSWELIVIDDGSDDETPEILASFRDPRIRVRRLSAHSGRAAARNAGLDLVTGSYVAMCDSDDISLPHRFARQVAFLDAHPNVDVVSGHMMVFDDHSAPRRGTTFPEVPAEIHRRFRKGKMGLVHAASMLRARCFIAFGRYREELERAEDFELLRRIHPFCAFRTLPDVLLLYRHEVTRTPWAKWLQTRRYHRYARYLSDANGSTPRPVMAFDAFSRRWRHYAADYTIEWMKYVKFNLMSWVRDVQARRVSESPLPRAAGQV